MIQSQLSNSCYHDVVSSICHRFFCFAPSVITVLTLQHETIVTMQYLTSIISHSPNPTSHLHATQISLCSLTLISTLGSPTSDNGKEEQIGGLWCWGGGARIQANKWATLVTFTSTDIQIVVSSQYLPPGHGHIIIKGYGGMRNCKSIKQVLALPPVTQKSHLPMRRKDTEVDGKNQNNSD